MQNDLDQEWIETLTRDITLEVGTVATELLELSRTIHDHPELKFEENSACGAITGFLRTNGFTVREGIAEMPTSFRAEHRFGVGGPTVAVFCEYDALPGIGHACGHNIIASAGAGAGVVVLKWAQKLGVTDGKVVVIGSPGEEGGGGKIFLIDNGELSDVDCAIMVHPSGYNAVDRSNLGRLALEFTFYGKASHAAAAPDRAINALDGVTLFLTAIGLLRQQLRSDARLHAIVLDGGQSVNIIPERAKVRVFVRSPDEQYLRNRMLAAVIDAANGCGQATGTKVEMQEVAPHYQSIVTNPVIADLAARTFKAIGRSIDALLPGAPTSGSTDMGNVSRVIPAIHANICVIQGLATHTREFERAAGGVEGESAVLDGAILLGTVLSALLADPNLVVAARSAFDAQVFETDVKR